jgi:glycine cleavage system H protein
MPRSAMHPPHEAGGPVANLHAGEAFVPLPGAVARRIGETMASKVPEDLRYSKEHEWLKVEGKRGRIGITDHAQHALTDIVYVKLPSKGARVKAGASLGEVESIKSVSPIYSPASGTVVDANTALEATPELMNQEPYGKGWFVVLELDDAAGDSKNLLDAKHYRAHIGE